MPANSFANRHSLGQIMFHDRPWKQKAKSNRHIDNLLRKLPILSLVKELERPVEVDVGTVSTGEGGHKNKRAHLAYFNTLSCNDQCKILKFLMINSNQLFHEELASFLNNVEPAVCNSTTKCSIWSLRTMCLGYHGSSNMFETNLIEEEVNQLDSILSEISEIDSDVRGYDFHSIPHSTPLPVSDPGHTNDQMVTDCQSIEDIDPIISINEKFQENDYMGAETCAGFWEINKIKQKIDSETGKENVHDKELSHKLLNESDINTIKESLINTSVEQVEMCFTDPKVTTQLDQDFIFELIQALSSKKCANSIEERSISSSKFVIIVENLLLKKIQDLDSAPSRLLLSTVAMLAHKNVQIFKLGLIEPLLRENIHTLRDPHVAEFLKRLTKNLPNDAIVSILSVLFDPNIKLSWDSNLCMIIAQLVNSSAQLTQLQVRHLLELMQEAMADQKSGEYISKDPKFSGLLKAIVIRYGSEQNAPQLQDIAKKIQGIMKKPILNSIKKLYKIK